jgi:hypothetical protein
MIKERRDMNIDDIDTIKDSRDMFYDVRDMTYVCRETAAEGREMSF